MVLSLSQSGEMDPVFWTGDRTVTQKLQQAVLGATYPGLATTVTGGAVDGSSLPERGARPPTAVPRGGSDPRAPAAPRPPPVGYKRPKDYVWADLLERTFAIDVLACPDCGGRLRLLATIADRAVIEKILRHLGLPVHAPRAAPARGIRDASRLRLNRARARVRGSDRTNTSTDTIHDAGGRVPG